MITNNNISDLVKAGKMLDPQLFSSADIQAPHLNAAKIFEGAIVEGRVKNITDYGVFIDLGGIDGLLHITDLSWGRVNHPSELIGLDDNLTVKIIDFDEDNKRISLGLKQLTPHPWENVEESYPEGAKIRGKIVSMTNYGVFVEIEPGIEGLLHVSEMSWARQVKKPSEMYSLGDEVEAVVISFDPEERKISLGTKQLLDDPWDQTWENVEESYPEGAKIRGKIVSMTNYGVFVEIEPGIEGLLHVSEMSWARHVKKPSEMYSLGDEVEAVVISFDPEERKISLGTKQLLDDPWDQIEEKYIVGTIVKGKILNMKRFGAFVGLEDGIDALMHVSDLSWTKVITHPKEMFEIGQEVEARVLDVSKEDRRISLGFKQMQDDPWPEIMEYFEIGKEVSGVIVRVIDKGVILNLEMNTEGLIPFLEIPEKKRKELKAELKPNEKLSGLVSAVNLEDRKIILFNEEISQ